MIKKLKVLSLFSGIGAPEKALSNLGINYELVGFSEIDKYAIKSYCAIHNVDENLNLGDISKIRIEDIPECDLLLFGFPCQDISVVGKQKGIIKGETRSGLLYECKKIIENKKPKYLLMENVKNLVSKKFKPQFDEWLKYLESLGYTSYWKVLNSQNYGIPQNRNRVYCVSILNDEFKFEFPKEVKLTTKLKDILESDVDKKYNLMKSKDFYLKNSFDQEKKGNGFKFRPHIKNNANIAYTITTRAGSRMDDNYIIDIDLPYEYIEYTNNFLFKNNLIEEFEEIKNHDIRKLTPLECFRLMGFSDKDLYKCKEIKISDTQLYKQAGNSIVVNVLEEIFKKLLPQYIN